MAQNDDPAEHLSPVARKIAELEGDELNYWVSRALGSPPHAARDFPSKACERWDEGGPIIDREHINTTWIVDEWAAEQQGGCISWEPGYGINQQRGPTLLVAAMRCFVASKFGDTVATEAGVRQEES